MKRLRAQQSGLSRREFLSVSALGSGGGVLGSGRARAAGPAPLPAAAPAPIEALDLAPARWLWYPSQRCLPNTFVLFRRELELAAAPRRAAGWVCADSRYRLSLNGERIQWGPAPADPRWAEADPVDLTPHLAAGTNVIGATVLFYGVGEGTWPIGKPGFIFRLEIEHADGRKELVVSDESWRCFLARAWRPGQFKRWYLRALQEEFDARLHTDGWDRPGFAAPEAWLAPLLLDCPADRPAGCSTYSDYLLDARVDPKAAALRPRQIPMLAEHDAPAPRLADSFQLAWRRAPVEYFECRTPGCFEIVRESCATNVGPDSWRVSAPAGRAACLTFELAEQVVGWPSFTIEAPAGTVVELMTQESHDLAGPPWLDTHFFAWTRFICRDGVNRFEPFDFESLRWFQLHIRGAPGEVVVRDVGVRRRVFPWPNPPDIRCSEPALQRLLDASVNTLNNSAQETIVDGMGRERQQYSGDCGHQLHAIYLAFGEERLPARYLSTFSQGITLDGYFLDCWPAYDRLARLMERQVNMTGWGPLLDHGVGFNFDCWHHYLYTGDRDALREPYPRLVRFFQYLTSLIDRSGLLPVTDIGVPSVWIDHQAYQRPRHKQCAFNLYAAAMLRHALVPLAALFDDDATARAARRSAARLQAAAVTHFWDAHKELFVNNLPWLYEEPQPRLCDRSLATAVLFDQCPDGKSQACLAALAEPPPEMGLSYPCNANWRLWALAKGGRADVLLDELRARWATMPSVLQNNTIQEDWTARPDSTAQWSHCAVVPLYTFFMDIAGIRPTRPGFAECEIRPQLGDLGELELTAHTVRGPLRFAASGSPGRRQLALELPGDCRGALVLPEAARTTLDAPPRPHAPGLARYPLPSGRRIELEITAPQGKTGAARARL